MEIINFVEAFRKEKNVTQEDLANYLGISRQTLMMIENKSSVSLELAFKISKYFGKNLEEVFKLKEDVVLSDYDKLLEDIKSTYGKFTIIIKNRVIFRTNTGVSELGPESLISYTLPNFGKMRKLCIVNNRVYELIPTRDYLSRNDRVLHNVVEMKSFLDFDLIDFDEEKTWNYKNSKNWNKFMNEVE